MTQRIFVDQINEEVIISDLSTEELEFILDGILEYVQEGGGVDFRIKKGYLHSVYGAKSITNPSRPIGEVVEVTQVDSNFTKAFVALFNYYDGGSYLHLHFATLSILKDLALNQQAPGLVREVIQAIEERLTPEELSKYY